VSVGLLGVAVAAGSLVLVDTPSLTVPKCEPPPGGFFWRYEDVPQALKQPVELCWSFAGGVGVAPVQSAVTVHEFVLPLVDQAPRVQGPSTLFDEVPPLVVSPKDR
jgi:hypothetical protein